MTPGPEDLLSQAEKLDVLRNDETVRKQREQQQQERRDNTLLGFAQQETIPQGRFTAPGGVSTPTVTGTTPIVKYPAASTPWQGPDLVGDEPPTNYRIDEMAALNPEPSSSPAQQTGPADGDVTPSLLDKAPLGDAQRAPDAGPLSSSNTGSE
jgi:hypothetical protein